MSDVLRKVEDGLGKVSDGLWKMSNDLKKVLDGLSMHQCFEGRSLQAAELDCCNDCIYSIREINSEIYNGKV